MQRIGNDANVIKRGHKMSEATIKAAVDAGHIKVTKEEKTQNTRGKGSRPITFSWDNISFEDMDGVMAYYETPEGVLKALSESASQANEQEAWEANFELSDFDKQVRAAARKLVGLLPGVDTIEKAEEFVRAQIEAATAAAK